jgi:hypothetical protein
MPLSAFGFWRRALVPLLIVYALAAAAVNPELLNLRDGATFAAVVFGPEVLVTLLAVLAFRQFRLVPLIPAYFVFRLFRAYIGLEVLLSLHQKVARKAVAATAPQHADLRQVSA